MTQFLANGLCSSAVYALVALGFGLILFAAKTFHIAHGAVFTAAGYACYSFSVSLASPLSVAIAVGLAAGTLLGVLVEVLVYHPLVDPRRSRAASPMVIMVSSLGAYIVVVNVVALLYGNDTKMLRPGIEKTVVVAGVILTYVQIGQLLAALTAFLMLWLFLVRTPYGRAFRALADDPELVSVLGHNVRRLRLGVFALGSALAAAGGIAAALDLGTDPNGGLNAVLVGAVATIVGGIGRFLAPALGAVILGVLQSVVVWQTSAKWSSAIVFATLLVVLLLRPQGILTRGRRLEEL